ncbi:hypothetical protein [Natrinema sp. DC36]|uniref:hypothetical protein n=1 Tax=Natrinema sp. DC36 TaxID=2878680 RepID=UPI001CF09B64|nr:hypothetical protein [Natrinema sp. DC36]
MTAGGDDGSREKTAAGDESEVDTAAANEFDPDPERVEFLREVADDVRGDTSERKQLANILYRTSDLYDEGEETSPEEIVRNVKFILEVTERGGLER